MASGKTTTDHEEIRRWAEERGGQPATVKGTERGGEEAGMIRIDFPGYSGEGKLEPITWDEWFEKFDEKNLALVYQDKTSGGKESFFNKLVSRGSAESGGRGGSRSRRGSARTSRSTRSSSGARSAAGRGKSKSSGTRGAPARGRTSTKRSGRTSGKGRSGATKRSSTARKSAGSRSRRGGSSSSRRGSSKKK